MGERWNEGERKRKRNRKKLRTHELVCFGVCLCFSAPYEFFCFLGVVLEISSMWLSKPSY